MNKNGNDGTALPFKALLMSLLFYLKRNPSNFKILFIMNRLWD